MKAILISIKPKHNKNILNLIKLWEIRKKFPSDYAGWIYIYNTKDTKDGYLTNAYINGKLEFITSFTKHEKYRGKIIARFWCDKVEEYVNGAKIVCGREAHFNTYKFILKDTCLTEDELYEYVDDLSFKAIRITKVEPFNKTKELKEFLVHSHTVSGIGFRGEAKKFEVLKPLARAPQSWCYIEV